jgi:hypothetical protein
MSRQPRLRRSGQACRHFRGAGLRHDEPQKQGCTPPGAGKAQKRRRVPPGSGDLAGERGAQNGAEADRETNRSHCEIETADPTGQVCSHKGSHDTEYGATQSVERLHEDEDIWTRHTREEKGPDRQCDEPEQQHRTPAQTIGGAADPGREGSDHDLRDDNGRGKPEADPHRHTSS